MKKFNAEKATGLVRNLNGNYVPSNERSREKLSRVFKHATGVEMRTLVITADMIDEYRALAKAAGYRIYTSIKSL